MDKPYGTEESAFFVHGDTNAGITSSDLIEEVSIDGMCGVY